MKKIWSIIFSVLGIAFLIITFLKYGPESEPKSTEETAQQKSLNKKEVAVEFWELYNEASDLRIARDYQKAAEYYRRALQKKPEHLDTIYYLGNMELTLGNFESAEKRWNSLIEINNASARGHVQLGTVYSCRRLDNPLFDLPKATRHFEKASSLNREITGPLLQLAKIDILNRRFDDAEERLLEVTKSNFRSFEGFFLRGYLAWKAGNTAEVQRHLGKSRSIAEGSEKFANVGEGTTDSGEDPMLDNASRCALLTSEIQTILNRYLIDNSYKPDKIYETFDNIISSNHKSHL
ncbi:tetratricopeptide repeat protein [Aliifodinibius sp. S!AR15-10]|uniref:tetratricopeptide repeat protein n=1 Tax=Aliifodinibius sp. S!AR15-10 TaxID=2950437 RepID=UPI0028603F86|nr:tetratricopeptide repeat protein [Aliifodinibius sp. S!AR15-10]MDR8390733.1 tetratricopeptide repeat protein [Aliifodinibius sp. S!AR15-10]